MYFVAKVTSAVCQLESAPVHFCSTTQCHFCTMKRTARSTTDSRTLPIAAMAADRPYARSSQYVLLSLSRIFRNTHVVRAEPYDREVVAIVQFHSWYHLDALHATPRHTLQQLLACRLTANCGPKTRAAALRAQGHSLQQTDPHSDRTRLCALPSLSLSCSVSLSNL